MMKYAMQSFYQNWISTNSEQFGLKIENDIGSDHLIIIWFEKKKSFCYSYGNLKFPTLHFICDNI